MNLNQVIKCAHPLATAQDMENIIWNRTPYPAQVSARALYKAASTYRRAKENGRTLCDFCDNQIPSSATNCKKCAF